MHGPVMANTNEMDDPRPEGDDAVGETLLQHIRRLVRDERYVVGDHAQEMLDERKVTDWQAAVALEDGAFIAEHLDADPNPMVEVRDLLPDGTDFKAVWSLLPSNDLAKLVTVHYFDRKKK